MRGEVANEKIEPAVAVPIDGADFGPDAPAGLLRRVVAVMRFAGRNELLGGGQLGLFRCADVAEERNAAIAGADQ